MERGESDVITNCYYVEKKDLEKTDKLMVLGLVIGTNFKGIKNPYFVLDIKDKF